MWRAAWVILLPLWVWGAHIRWLGAYDQAHVLARQMHKPMLVLLIDQNSQTAAEVVSRVFTDHAYVERLNRLSVPVIVRADKHSHYPVELFYTTCFPTLFLVDSQNELFLTKPLYAEEITPKRIVDVLLPALLDK